ncbi:glycosyltransferase family 4 protein [Absicoccus porci]|uniref:glycosyltransferase family 4 protein n=1 Tax=Absicoccus porci TaxID=2486576 RepID=UPI002943F02F|nr:glycosyltransferase family 4 protein [Absicoccus porci]
MKVLVAADAHIYQAMDGTFWTPKIYSYNFWKRYLDVFDDVKIVARLKSVNLISKKWMRVDGPHVEVFGIPFYQGPRQLLTKYVQIQSILKNASKGCDVAIIRMPSQTAYMTYKHLPKDIPVAGEVVYDPTDDVNDKSAGFVMHALNEKISKQLKEFCLKANGVSYVTEKSIQKHYPSKAKIDGESERYFESYYSTITLSDNAYTCYRDYSGRKNLILALSDVSMNTERKGERTLINIVKLAVDKGYDVKAIIIGDGSKKSEFMQLADRLGIKDRILFTGLLSSSDDVRKYLLKSDVFVFPTKGEGLPRGILEAMAVGMPVLSSPVGGIPEILDQECLYAPNDVEGYVREICKMLDDTSVLNEMSKRNFIKSQEFDNRILQQRRNEFYQKLRKLAE